jgi:hypothetical protein
MNAIFHRRFLYWTTLLAFTLLLPGCPDPDPNPNPPKCSSNPDPPTYPPCELSSDPLNDRSGTSCYDLVSYLQNKGVHDDHSGFYPGLGGATYASWELIPASVLSVNGGTCEQVPSGTDIRFNIVTVANGLNWTPPAGSSDTCRAEASRWSSTYVAAHECAHVAQANQYALEQPMFVSLPVTVTACGATTLDNALRNALQAELSRRNSDLQAIFGAYDLSIDGAPALVDCSKCDTSPSASFAGTLEVSVEDISTTSSNDDQVATDIVRYSWILESPASIGVYKFHEEYLVDNTGLLCPGHSEAIFDTSGRDEAGYYSATLSILSDPKFLSVTLSPSWDLSATGTLRGDFGTCLMTTTATSNSVRLLPMGVDCVTSAQCTLVFRPVFTVYGLSFHLPIDCTGKRSTGSASMDSADPDDPMHNVRMSFTWSFTKQE